MNDSIEANPREVIGGNKPPLARSIAAEENIAESITSFLGDEYRIHPPTVEELLDAARAIPKVIEDDETKGKVVTLIKRLRDTAAKLEAFRVKEQEPYLRGKQAVDQFFFGLIDKVKRRNKADRPGAADVLQQRLTDYDTAVLERERERRRLIAEAEERAAREAAEKADREARAAEEARQAAERARKPDIAAQKADTATAREADASESRTGAAIAQGRAETAHIDTLAKPADIMRRRGDDGTLSTMATEPYAVVENETLLDQKTLWPFIPLAAKEQAVRAWAKTTGHNQQMAGAKVGRRPKSVVR